MDHHSNCNKLQFIAFGRLPLNEVSTLRFEEIVSLQQKLASWRLGDLKQKKTC